MSNITLSRLNELKKSFYGKRIAVVGDVMVDSYLWGNVKRISPEAPVPVVEVENEFYRFGGAANVANNIKKLGSTPLTIGVIGYDDDGTRLKALMHDEEISSQGLVVDESRPTTSKTRVIAENQQVVRVDKECKDYVSETIENKILDSFKEMLDSIDAVILQDYNKGVLTKKVINEIIDLSNQKNKIITVDPKFNNFFEYKNTTVFKPNRKETEDAFGIRIKSDSDRLNAGKSLLEKLQAKYVLLTMGSQGLSLFEKGSKEIKIATKANEVADVSGAGDTVISTLTLALASGANFYEASQLANYAAGLVCEEVGIVPIEIDNLFDTIIQQKKWIR